MFKYFKDKKNIDKEFSEMEKRHVDFTKKNKERILADLKRMEEFDEEFDKQWESIQKR